MARVSLLAAVALLLASRPADAQITFFDDTICVPGIAAVDPCLFFQGKLLDVYDHFGTPARDFVTEATVLNPPAGYEWWSFEVSWTDYVYVFAGELAAGVTDHVGGTFLAGAHGVPGALPSGPVDGYALSFYGSPNPDVSEVVGECGTLAGLEECYSTNVVPEPASLLLLATGLAGVLVVSRRRATHSTG